MTRQWQQGVLRGPSQPAVDRKLVVKIGGSLLSWKEWPQLIDGLITSLGDRAMSIVVGGGAIVDGLRTIDAAAPQLPHMMHDLAIDAMHFTSRLISQTTGLPLTAEPAGNATPHVLDVPLWLLGDRRGTDMPAGWHVTSDSIAARVAAAYDAELLLAKSGPPPCCSGLLEKLSASGWVDGYFPIAAGGLDSIAWAAPVL